MRPSKILRVPRSDEKDQDTAVVLHVQPTAATIPLNVAITATDGSEGFGLTLKDSKTKALKDPSSEQSDDDWKAVLRAVLLADAGPEDLLLLRNIQLSALVKKDGISISVREDVSGIRRRLGVLQLSPQEVEIELWDWLDRVCKEKDEAEARSHRAEREAAEVRAKLDKLEKQIQDLSGAKKKHEDALILQFQRLLNEKKKKIRELSRGGHQRTAPVTAAAAELTDEDEPEEEKPKPASRSKISKTISGRKRKQEDKPPSEDEDEDDGSGEGMVVDPPSPSQNDGSDPADPGAEDRRTTDDETLGGTTDDDDDDEEL